jgi:ethanolamine ammonia-lyase small subunit
MPSPVIIKKYIVQQDEWHSLKAYTPARIALGRTGVSIPLKEILHLQLAHAHARDAVYAMLDIDGLYASLQTFNLHTYLLQTRSLTRKDYLKRPDHGRRLNDASAELLKEETNKHFDVAIVVADGLSSPAVNLHAFTVLQLLIPGLKQKGFSVAPLTIVKNGRVAVADEIGSLFHAKLSLILIGERPGLSSSTSMGAYITYRPKIGLTDEKRFCVSNIHANGLNYQLAVEKIFWLITESLRMKISGVQSIMSTGNFLSSGQLPK